MPACGLCALPLDEPASVLLPARGPSHSACVRDPARWAARVASGAPLSPGIVDESVREACLGSIVQSLDETGRIALRWMRDDTLPGADREAARVLAQAIVLALEPIAAVADDPDPHVDMPREALAEVVHALARLSVLLSRESDASATRAAFARFLDPTTARSVYGVSR